MLTASKCAAWAIGPQLAQQLGVPVITTYHGTYAGFGRAIAPVARRRGFLSRTYGAFLERRAGAGRAAVVAVSARVAAEADGLALGKTPATATSGVRCKSACR